MLLVAEGEPLVRMTAVDELEEAGFHVLEATNADEALKARFDEVRVLFTDVHMPGWMARHWLNWSPSAGRMCCC
jgi:CheY-like chemotaxis protein